MRKIAASLAAGCSIILKCPEETPGSPIGLVSCFHDAGVPAGVLNLVYGAPAEISEYLIPHPIMRKVSFTGSVPVGKHLAALAGLHMKRVTMELGGHAPVLVFDDVDTDDVAKLISAMKYRNAGQVCISPTRFFVHEKVYDKFVGKFTDHRQGHQGRRRPRARRPRWARSPTRAASMPCEASSATRRRRAPRSRPAASGSATRATSSSRRC